MPKIRKGTDNKVLGEFAELCFLQKAAAHGLVVSKPYGDSMPYDVITDNGSCLKRVQVKSTTLLNRRSYHVVVARAGKHGLKLYSLKDADFLAVYVIPENAWYLIPVTILKGRRTVRVFPHTRNSRSQWERYREAWHLLMPRKSVRRIFAQAAASSTCEFALAP